MHTHRQAHRHLHTGQTCIHPSIIHPYRQAYKQQTARPGRLTERHAHLHKLIRIQEYSGIYIQACRHPSTHAGVHTDKYIHTHAATTHTYIQSHIHTAQHIYTHAGIHAYAHTDRPAGRRTYIHA